MNILNELSWLGKYLGSRLDLVQAGGGNVSIKNDGELFIKSSGCVLSEISDTYGYSRVSISKLAEYVEKLDAIEESNFGSMLQDVVIGDFKRPSIETPLHYIMQDKIVIHVHPICVLALTSQQNSKELIKSLFPESLWVEYGTPGKKLALRFQEQYTSKKSQLAFLENHGIVIGASSVDEGITSLENILEKVENEFGFDFSSERKTSEIQKLYRKALNDNRAILKVENGKFDSAFKSCHFQYEVICPDDVVYIGPEILKLDKLDKLSIKEFVSKYGGHPSVIVFDESTYILSNNIIKCRQIYEQLASNVFAREKVSGIKTINQDEVDFLSNWEAEKYRQQLKG